MSEYSTEELDVMMSQLQRGDREIDRLRKSEGNLIRQLETMASRACYLWHERLGETEDCPAEDRCERQQL